MSLPTNNINELLFKTIKAEKSDILVIIVYAFIIGLLYLIIPLAVQELVNIIAFGVVLQPLYVLTALVTGILILIGILQVIQRYIVEIIQQRVFVTNSFDLVNRIKLSDKDALTNKEVNLFFEVLSLQKSYSKLLVGGFAAVLQALIGLIVLCFYHFYFSLLALFIFVASVLILYLGGLGGLKTSLKESSYKYNLIHWLQELAAGQDIIKFNVNNDYLIKKTDNINLNYINSRGKHFGILMRQQILGFLVQILANSSLLALGGVLVIEGQLSLGQLIAAELLVTSSLAGLDKFINQTDIIFDFLTALSKLNLLHDLSKSSFQAGNKSLSSNNNLGLKIECKNLYFNYGITEKDRTEIIKNFSFNLASAEWINIDSRLSLTKNSLFNLLAGLSKADKGLIYFDDLEIKDLTSSSLGEEIAFIQKNPEYIFEASLQENILLGRTEKLPLKLALEASDLDSEISNLAAGLNTLIESKGKNIPNSQIAKILISRALITKPRLILLHEDILLPLDQKSKLKFINSLQNNILGFKPSLIFFGEDYSLKDFFPAQIKL